MSKKTFFRFCVGYSLFGYFILLHAYTVQPTPVDFASIFVKIEKKAFSTKKVSKLPFIIFINLSVLDHVKNLFEKFWQET